MGIPQRLRQDPAIVATIGAYRTVPMNGPLEEGMGPLLLGSEGFIVGHEPPVEWADLVSLSVDMVEGAPTPFAIVIAKTANGATSLGVGLTRAEIEKRVGLVQTCLDRCRTDRGLPPLWPAPDLEALDRLSEDSQHRDTDPEALRSEAALASVELPFLFTAVGGLVVCGWMLGGLLLVVSQPGELGLWIYLLGCFLIAAWAFAAYMSRPR